MVTMYLIHILIAGIKLNSHKFRHANELEAEFAFSMLIELSNVCGEKQSAMDANNTPRCYTHSN